MAIAKQGLTAQADACRVAIVDDEPGMRFLLAGLMESAQISYQLYDSAESFLADQDRGRFGCLLLDIELAGMSGLELQAELRKHSNDLAIVVISASSRVSDAIQAFQNKANAFFEKPFDTGQFMQAVQAVVAEWESKQARLRAVAERLNPLTPREKQVMQALMTGDSTIQIAHELGISSSTVEKHRVKVYEKTGVDSVVGLIHLTAI